MREEYWRKMWEKERLEKTKAIFVVGWLTSCLQDAGIYREKAEQYVAEGKAEAEKVFGKPY